MTQNQMPKLNDQKITPTFVISPLQANEITAVILKEYKNIAGIIIQKDNQVLYENYFNQCCSTSCFHIFSVTKSIVSLLYGIALDKGYISDIHQHILDFFPDYKLKRGEKTLPKITIYDMLTMTVPYKYKFAPYTKYFTSLDWVKSSLDMAGGNGPLGAFRYAPIIGPDILSGILKQTTGYSVLDFAKEYLFTPLQITVEKSIIFADKKEQMAFYKTHDISGWVADPRGVNTAGWGLTLSTLDMAKLGQLYLNKGIWNNSQIVSSEWIKESTKEHSKWEKINLSYGYLWWIIDKTQNACAAMGDGGNVIYFNRKFNMVISISSLFSPKVKDRIDFIRNILEPMFI